MRVAALSTAFEPAKLEEGEESLVLRLHPKAHGGLLGHRHPRTRRRTRRVTASRGACPSTPDAKGKKSADSLPLSTYSALGALRQDPGRAAESPAEARTRGDQGVAKYVCLRVCAARLRGAPGRNATSVNGRFMFDVIIAGGGPTGLMRRRGLAHCGRRVRPESPADGPGVG